MKYGVLSGMLWGVDTVVLSMALLLTPFLDSPSASITGAALHDASSAIILLIYMGIRGRLRDTVAAIRTRSGKAVMLAALLGGPVGMSGYLIAINNIGPGYTAIISSFYPAFGTLLAFILLKERMRPGQIIALAALTGAASYLFYYKAIDTIGASRGMALNISYAAWAVIFALVLQGTVPTSLQVVCCIVALTGTVLAASPDWRELRLTRPSAGRTADGFSKKAAEGQDDGTDRDAALPTAGPRS